MFLQALKSIDIDSKEIHFCFALSSLSRCHAASLFTSDERKVWFLTCWQTRRLCIWRHWYRPQGTKWQHSLAWFRDYETSIFTKQDRKSGERLPCGAGIAQWLERRTRDRKVAGSNPCWIGGSIFFSRVNFLCWLLFRYPFHPRVTSVARKRPRSFCQNAGGRLQLNTHTPYVCGFAWSDMVHGCMVYTERAKMAAVSCGTSHASVVSTPLRWIFKKTCYKKLFTHVESHASAVSLLESEE